MSPSEAESLISAAVGPSGYPCQQSIDAIPLPVYLTDSDGRLTAWNAACAEFAGREPDRARDRWCVTWRLHTTAGDPLPHDACPMAVAVKERRAIRGEIAIAERPDGSRRAFTPYPTPLFDPAGNLAGAVNMLVDVSAEQGQALRDQADRCRRLAAAVTDRDCAAVLLRMADEYRRSAEQLD